MFSSFRDKFKAVQNDVILSFQRLTGPEPLPTGVPSGDDDVASVAGARLLSHYQNLWSQLHTNTERAVSGADTLNRHINAVRHRCHAEHAGMTELHRRLTGLPDIASKVHNMIATVASLQAEFVQAELELAELEHRAALDNLEDRKMRERAKLEAYRRARQQHFEDLKITAAQQHLERASQLERRRRSEQAERHSTFSQLSHQEIDHFRRHQSLDVVRPVSNHPVAHLALEEVDIRREDDDAALAAFLADTELDPEDPARDMDSNPEDPAVDFDSSPEDPARDLDSGPEDPAGRAEPSPEHPASGIGADLEDAGRKPGLNAEDAAGQVEKCDPQGTTSVVEPASAHPPGEM